MPFHPSTKTDLYFLATYFIIANEHNWKDFSDVESPAVHHVCQIFSLQKFVLYNMTNK